MFSIGHDAKAVADLCCMMQTRTARSPQAVSLRLVGAGALNSDNMPSISDMRNISSTRHRLDQRCPADPAISFRAVTDNWLTLKFKDLGYSRSATTEARELVRDEVSAASNRGAGCRCFPDRLLSRRLSSKMGQRRLATIRSKNSRSFYRWMNVGFQLVKSLLTSGSAKKQCTNGYHARACRRTR
jgi:hypothetical protein